MKIGIYNPYLDTLGGGEKYTLDIAKCLAEGHEVFVFWDDDTIREKAEKKFAINLSQVKFSKNIFKNRRGIVSKFLITRTFDAFFFVSDGSIPFLFAKKNFLIFQFSVNWVHFTGFLTKLKLSRISNILCYSEFVKSYLLQQLSLSTSVVPPAVHVENPGKVKKENIILSVGRFTGGMNRKKQEVLLEVFKKMCKHDLKGWKLVLVGSYLPQDKEFVESLKKSSQNYPIEILTSLSYEELTEYYQRSKIYWHATGYGENLDTHPEYAEHFGITTVEAMGARCVPIVINRGGQKEIVQDQVNGYLWSSLDEFREKTLLLVKNKTKWEKMAHEAEKRARDFSYEKFCDTINMITSQ